MESLASLFPPPGPEEAPIAQGFMEGMAGQPDDAFLTGGDRDRLTLSPDDEALIQAIAAVNPQTVVAVMDAARGYKTANGNVSLFPNVSIAGGIVQ